MWGGCKICDTFEIQVNLLHMLAVIYKLMEEIGALQNSDGDGTTTSPRRVHRGSSVEGKLEREKRKKMELAAKRRERIMAQMARMQRNFIRENKELFETTSSDTLTPGDDSRCDDVL